ncbi:MAG: DUF1194 domain-containing protein [Paracoccaceae bacterium]
MRAILAFILAWWPIHVFAQTTEVDVELVLAVDVSRSMEPWELEIQRRGYAEALRSDAVWAAIQRGLLQRIAITYVEWAGFGTQRIIVPWTLIETREDAEQVADKVTAHFDEGLRRTSITSALDYSAYLIKQNEYDGLRRVIDISGDGPNNSGGTVSTTRDAIVAQGITINGLPLMTYDPNGPYARWGIPDLDAYYRACVIGGPGAFVIPVSDWDNFADAVRRKLVLEIAQAPLPVWRVQSQTSYNCRIGEDIWQRNMDLMTLP